MAKIYANLILRGAINPKTGVEYILDDVPLRIRDMVAAIINQEG